MSDAALSRRDRNRCLVALIGAMAIVSMSSSLTWPILAESLRNRGFSDSAISLSAAVQFAGIVIVALVATRLIPRTGFLRAIALGLGFVAGALLLLPLVRDYHAWFAIRFLLGIGVSLLFTAGDTWINQILDNRVRGRWLGVYSTVGMAGWAIGPIVGSYLDPETFWPFLCGLVAVAVAALLLVPTRGIEVGFSGDERRGAGLGALGIVFFAAPTVLLSSAMFGVLEGGMPVLRPSLHDGHPGPRVPPDRLRGHLGGIGRRDLLPVSGRMAGRQARPGLAARRLRLRPRRDPRRLSPAPSGGRNETPGGPSTP